MTEPQDFSAYYVATNQKNVCCVYINISNNKIIILIIYFIINYKNIKIENVRKVKCSTIGLEQ